MAGPWFDGRERLGLCDLLAEVGPSAPTLLEGWTTHDLAAHLVLREHDLVAAPCLVLPGPFERFAERRRVALVTSRDFESLVRRIRSGPPDRVLPPRMGALVREPQRVLRAPRGRAPSPRAGTAHPRCRARCRSVAERPPQRAVSRSAAARRRARRGVRSATGAQILVRSGVPIARLRGAPGELLLYLFGRQAVAQVEVTGSPEAVTAMRGTHLGM